MKTPRLMLKLVLAIVGSLLAALALAGATGTQSNPPAASDAGAQAAPANKTTRQPSLALPANNAAVEAVEAAQADKTPRQASLALPANNAAAQAVEAAQADKTPRPPSLALPANNAVAVEVRFASVDVVLDTQSKPLAAYQISLRAVAGEVRIVGIEGGEPLAYRDPPHYDPGAMQDHRVVIAAFNTAPAEQLPSGKIRVATIHLRIAGAAEPRFEAQTQAVATVDGVPIPATVAVVATRTQP